MKTTETAFFLNAKIKACQLKWTHAQIVKEKYEAAWSEAYEHEEELDTKAQAIHDELQQLQEEVTRAIKLSRTNTMTSTEFTVAAADRANKILAFDTNGEISVTQELGTYKGNWATATAYYGRDIVKDTSNNNISCFTLIVLHSNTRDTL